MIEILVTGEKLVGKGIRSLGTVIEEIIVSATDEIHVAAYLITSTTLVDLLAGAADRGIRVYVVVNDLGENLPESGKNCWQQSKSSNILQ